MSTAAAQPTLPESAAEQTAKELVLAAVTADHFSPGGDERGLAASVSVQCAGEYNGHISWPIQHARTGTRRDVVYAISEGIRRSRKAMIRCGLHDHQSLNAFAESLYDAWLEATR